MTEQTPPTIEEIITAWRTMAAALRPRRRRLVRLGARTAPIELVQFEQFRPRRSARRWLRGAPEWIIACYDNGGRRMARYTVLFGGSLWDTSFAHANWRAGLDPRIVPCLSMSDDPDHPQRVSLWGKCLNNSKYLGHKVCWLDLPPHIREHVMLRGSHTGI